MEIVWTVTLDTDTPGDPAALEEAAGRVGEQLQEAAFNGMWGALGDSASCEAAYTIRP